MKIARVICNTLLLAIFLTGCGTDKSIHASNHGRVSANQRVRMKTGSMGGLKYVWVRYKEDGRKKFIYWILFKNLPNQVAGIHFLVERESYQKGKYLGTSTSRFDSSGTEPFLVEKYQTLLYVSENLKAYDFGYKFSEASIRRIKSWSRRVIN